MFKSRLSASRALAERLGKLPEAEIVAITKGGLKVAQGIGALIDLPVKNDLENLAEKTVVLVDDGGVGEENLLKAIKEIRSQKPIEIIFTTPVIAKGVAEKVKEKVEKLIALEQPEILFGVSEYYEEN